MDHMKYRGISGGEDMGGDTHGNGQKDPADQSSCIMLLLLLLLLLQLLLVVL